MWLSTVSAFPSTAKSSSSALTELRAGLIEFQQMHIVQKLIASIVTSHKIRSTTASDQSRMQCHREGKGIKVERTSNVRQKNVQKNEKGRNQVREKREESSGVEFALQHCIQLVGQAGQHVLNVVNHVSRRGRRRCWRHQATARRQGQFVYGARGDGGFLCCSFFA